MNYDHPELIDRLAAQYVLGSLRGAARDRFERLIARRPDIAQRVGLWERRLAPVAYGLAPVAAPAAVRAALLAEVRQPPLPAAMPTPMPLRLVRRTRPLPMLQPSPASRRSVYLHRARFLAAACVCGLLIVGGLIKIAGARLSFPDGPHGQVLALAQIAGLAGLAERASLAEPELRGDELRPLPVMLAKLGMPGSSMGWMISLTPDHRKLTITASDDYLTAGRASVQLWWLGSDGAPKPLAILGTERDSTVVVDVPQGLDESRTLVFAITLEPPGGSPTGKPTRPVLDRVDKAAPAI